MRVVITGTPGTGKTKVARELARITGWQLFGLKEFVESRRLYRVREGQRIVDIASLGKQLLPSLASVRDYIVEGHLACELKIPADFVFVLRSHPDTLKKRLSARKYGRKKLEDNLLSEMLDYCVQRAEMEYGKKPLELDTTGRGAEECARIMLRAIKQKKKNLDSVDYSAQLMHYLRLEK